MNRPVITTALFLAMLVSAFAMRGFAAEAPQTPPPRQILVMLHLPVPHYRPGGAYGGAYDDQAGRQARRRIAARLARHYGMTLLSDWPMPALGVDCFVMEIGRAQTAAELAARVSHDPRVEWAQPLLAFHALGQPDPLYATQPSAALWHLDALHRVSTGRGVRIAIVDSGVDAQQPDLAGRIVQARDFVGSDQPVAEFHGTEVAGIIGARADNGAGIVGIAPQAELIALRACWQVSASRTLCNSFTLAKALQFAIDDGVQIINMSLSGPRDELLGRLLRVALQRGATVVAATDAEAADGGFPASFPGVIAVAADDASSKTTGNLATVLRAPGRDIPTTAPGRNWRFVSGSSFAAAHVSGLVALVKQLAPRSTMREKKSWALASGTDGTALAGTIDACATLRLRSPALTCSHARDQAMRASW